MEEIIVQRLVILVALLLSPVPVVLAQAYGLGRLKLLARRALPALSVILLGAGVLRLIGDRESYDLAPGTVLVGLGVVCYLVARRAGWPAVRGPVVWAAGMNAMPARWRWVLSTGAFGLALWLGERIAPNWLEDISIVGWRLTAKADLPGYFEQLSLWVLSVGLFVVAAVPRVDFVAAGRALRASWRDRRDRRAWGVVIGCMVVGLGLRLVWLETSIPLVFGDESSFARQAALLPEARAILFSPAHLSHPWLYSAAIGPFVQLIGRTLTAARMVSVISGVLTIPAVYLLAREMFDRCVAMAAAVFVTGWSVHLHFSRVALNNIVDPLFGALAFGFLLRGFRKGDRLSYVLSGLALGMSQYFYAGARLYPLFLAVYMAALAVLYRRQVLGQWRGLVLLVLVALLVTFPANYWLAVHGEPLSRRPDHVSILAPREDLDGRSQLQEAVDKGILMEYGLKQLEYAFLAYVFRYDVSNYYGGGYGMFLPAGAVAFLLGVLGALLRVWRRAELMLLGLAGATAMAGGALMFAPPHFTRYLVAVPALGVLVALGLVETARALIPRERWANGLALGLAGALALGSVVYYFDAHLDHLLGTFHPRVWQIRDVAQRIEGLPPDVQAYVIDHREFDLHAREVIGYMTGNYRVRYENYYQVNRSDYFDELPAGKYFFFVSPEVFDEVQFLLGSVSPWGYVLRSDVALPKGEPFVGYQLYVPEEK